MSDEPAVMPGRYQTRQSVRTFGEDFVDQLPLECQEAILARTPNCFYTALQLSPVGGRHDCYDINTSLPEHIAGFLAAGRAAAAARRIGGKQPV